VVLAVRAPEALVHRRGVGDDDAVAFFYIFDALAESGNRARELVPDGEG
jgi:hypothetical protein